MPEKKQTGNIFNRFLLDYSLYKNKNIITPLMHIFLHYASSFNLKYICDLYAKIPAERRENFTSMTALYHRFNRLVKQMCDEGYLSAARADKRVIFYTPTAKVLTCLKQAQNSNHTKNALQNWCKLPSRARDERIEAIKKTLNVNLLTDSDREEIKDLFEQYIDDINNRVIVLERIDIENVYGEDYKILRYSTRFNSKIKAKSIINKYNKIIKKTLTQYKTAVHLVLTTDPSRHKSLWHANRHFTIAFNKFMSFLKKRLGYRPPFLAVYEFTRTGLLHAHVLIFGISYLVRHEEITKEWEKCNQGSYNFIYALKATKKGWIYKREKPNDIKEGQTADDYLRTYLLKSINNPTALYLYWTFNKRFYTYARILTPEGEEDIIRTFKYYFLGSFTIENIPDFVIENLPSAPICYKLIPGR